VNRGLPKAALERVREALAPGSEVVRVRPLHGGISSSVHLVRLKSPDGTHAAVVVRRYGEYWQRIDPAACEREFRLLGVLAKNPLFPAPRPLLLDAEGGPFGAPTVVMTRLPGRPELAPRDLHGYLQQMAETLAALHRVPAEACDFLREQRAIVDRRLSTPAQTEDPLEQAIWEAVLSEWPRISAEPDEPRALVHGDYWPGNLLYRRGRLTGVVDWEQPRVGDPDKDVATCCADLWVLFGQPAADTFVALYESAAGRKPNNMRFWQLLNSTDAVPQMREWAVAYRVLGRSDLTAEVAVERVRAYARNALECP
jgi:aminoglycoside phosphotransferase (APT) family kinase protein